MKSFANLLGALLLIPLLLFAEQDPMQGKCMTCHKEVTAGLYQQWLSSAHARHDVACLDCHGAGKGDLDAFTHQGAYIATLVTPKDCGACHSQEAAEFVPSHHAAAGRILESNDAYMAYVAGGAPAAIAGCENCHGGRPALDPQSPNKLARRSWPNSGVGRLNPDGSLGACNACHTRHAFSIEQVRQPETCGKCHLGPDHPQKEIYEESKHGINYYTNIDKMNLEADRWVAGQDYFSAPTCATCHLSATKRQRVTHDAGARISWTLRPPLSTHTEGWQKKRDNLKEACSACHGPVFVDGHFYLFDGVVNLYNEKFARPAGEIMNIIEKNHSLKSPAAFSNKLEWTYWELWHHEGRRARHGASMMGPDYTWWHGIYEVAQHFYFKFIREARETGDAEAIAYIDNLLKNDPLHNWLSRSTKELKEDIRSGQMMKLYEGFFKAEMK